MSDEDVQYEDFYVVGLKDGSYRDVDDIKGETIYVHSSTSLTYDDAQDKLKKEADVNFNETGGYIQLKSVLIGDDGKKNDKLIFLSSNNHEIICENIEGFEKDTRIVHTVSVKIGNKDIARELV